MIPPCHLAAKSSLSPTFERLRNRGYLFSPGLRPAATRGCLQQTFEIRPRLIADMVTPFIAKMDLPLPSSGLFFLSP